MDRKDFFFRQKVQENELDAAFNDVENALWNIIKDLELAGITGGFGVSQQASPNMSVLVAGPGVAYDQLGRRISMGSNQTVSCTVDENAINTAVTTPGQSRILTLFLEFDRSLSDPRTDGNSDTVYFVRSESFSLNLASGAQSASPSPVALRSDQILLADITLTYGQTSIVNANISIARREGKFQITDSPRSINAVGELEAFTQLLGYYNDHVGGSLDRHTAAMVDYAGGGAWADGNTNPATTLELQIDKIISDLASTSSNGGADKIGIGALGAWADSTANAATTLFARINAIVAALAGTGGTAKVGGASYTGTGMNLTATTLQAQLRSIADAILTLTAAAASTGSNLIGGASYTGTGMNLTAVTVQAQLRAIVDAIVTLTGSQTISGAKTFSANPVLSGSTVINFGSARTYKTRIQATEFQLATDSSWSGEGWYRVNTLGYIRLISGLGGGAAYPQFAFKDLSMIPDGATITQVDFRWDSATTGGVPMRGFLSMISGDNTADSSDQVATASTSLETRSITGLSRVVDRAGGKRPQLLIQSNNGGTTPEDFYWAEVTWTMPGLR